MGHSNSSLNTFASCMAKYEHSYILHTPSCNPPSPHLAFGVMAHDVLYKAGKLRDEIDAGITPDYSSCIPSEVIGASLKTEFNIRSCYSYFVPVVKQVSAYEKALVQYMTEKGNEFQIERELKLCITVDQLREMGYKVDQPIVGIIDLLLYSKEQAIIIDYKFSEKRKTQDDFDMNSQLQLYAWFIHHLYDIPLHNIQYGYIDIPKQEFTRPTLLSNGKLSRAKSQNCSQELFKQTVDAIHGTWYETTPEGRKIVQFDPNKNLQCIPDEYYNCEPGGYYEEAYNSFALNKAAYLSMQYLDMDTFSGVISDLMNCAEHVDKMIREKMPFLHKYDSYSCKNCDYVQACKPWVTPRGGFNV